MRAKTVEQECPDFSRKSTVKVVQEYEAISGLEEANPKILNLAHDDFSNGLSDQREEEKDTHRSRY